MSNDTTRCTCPSGDGSLRWPCPAHPPEAQAQGGEDGLGEGGRYWRERAEFWRSQAVALGWREKRDAENGGDAPPSAPVGTRCNRPNVACAWPDCGRDCRHLAQQPAAVDRRHPYVQPKDHGGCANCGYPEWEPWHVLAAQPKRYNHMYTVAFTVISSHPEGLDVTPEDFRRALTQRMNDLDLSGEWDEAVGAPDDTYEMED